VFAGDELVATTRIHAYRQLWGGRALPMAGIAGVVVAPEWRGRGVARLLMLAAMQRSIDLGDLVSVLFPAVSTPYRRLGWEMGGAVSRTTLPAEALRRLGVPEVPVRRATLEDTDEMLRLVHREGVRTHASGPLELTSDDLREMLSDTDNFCYLAADGFLSYAWDGNDLRVERLVAESPETTRAFWALVGSGASTVRQVHTYLSADDPIHWFLDGMAHAEVQVERWMLRLLDASAAIAARGYPPRLDADVRLTLVDPWLPSCAGDFRLRVGSGSGELQPAEPDSGAVLMGPNGIAAMYAGTPMQTLRGARLVTGGNSDDDAVLDAIFACRCFMMDTF
jgi:predicted acetyltransferase